MSKWLVIALLLFAAPLLAQREGEDDIDPWNDFEAGGVAEDAYLPLTLGRDRTGLGLRARGSFGWNSNIFKEDRNEENAVFIDGASYVYAGHNFGVFAAGARARAAGRLYFGKPDASLWDLKLGGFFKIPYNGGIGFGLSGDVLYQQHQTYEITGALTRQDNLRSSAAIGRAHIGYQVSFVIFELGFTGKATDYTEEDELRSHDSWEIGADFGVTISIFDFLEVRPYVAFDYEWFRDQIDLRPDGTPRSKTDKLQLLKFSYGADARVNLVFLQAAGRVYSIRQDDSAAGYHRYWQYGVNGVADVNLTGGVRLTTGVHLWSREYDERIDVDDVGPDGQKTVHERFFRGYIELAWNFWEFFDMGARYGYERRMSNIDNGGYAAHTVTAFLEIGW